MTGDQFVEVGPDSTGKLIDNSELARSLTPGNPYWWVASKVYAAGAIVQPQISNGYYYVCTTGGTSGNSAPTWPTTSGGTVSDNGTIWQAQSIVERQRIVQADATNPAGLVAVVNNPPPPQTYGNAIFIAAEQLPAGAASDMQETLQLVLKELRVISMILQQGLNTTDDLDVMRSDPFITGQRA